MGARGWLWVLLGVLPQLTVAQVLLIPAVCQGQHTTQHQYTGYQQDGGHVTACRCGAKQAQQAVRQAVRPAGIASGCRLRVCNLTSTKSALDALDRMYTSAAQCRPWGCHTSHSNVPGQVAGPYGVLVPMECFVPTLPMPHFASRTCCLQYQAAGHRPYNS